MSSAVEANVKVSHVGAHHFKTKTPDTPYPFTSTNDGTSAVIDGEDIVPYMARVYSPIRVTQYSSPNMQVKRKSRVDDVARNTVFNLRPLKRGDKVTPWNRFRSPDATLPTLSFIPPWVSITKSDYADPRLFTESEISLGGNTPQQLTRSLTDFDDCTPRIYTPATPALSVTSQVRTPKILTSRSESRTTGKTPLIEKKVKILDPVNSSGEELYDMAENGHVNGKSPVTTPASILVSPVRVSPTLPKSPKNRLNAIKLPDSGVNYYSGYLPPEFSEQIAEQLAFKNGEEMEDLSKRYQFLGTDGQHYKPLVGDRTWYMKDPYPAQPKLYQSDIEQLRFEGHKRLHQSNGQTQSHFSVLKRNGPSIRPAHNGAQLEEAMRTQRNQHRMSKSAVVGKRRVPTMAATTGNMNNVNNTMTSKRMPQVTTSMDMFDRQREKTYHLQNLAREMINK